MASATASVGPSPAPNRWRRSPPGSHIPTRRCLRPASPSPPCRGTPETQRGVVQKRQFIRPRYQVTLRRLSRRPPDCSWQMTQPSGQHQLHYPRRSCCHHRYRFCLSLQAEQAHTSYSTPNTEHDRPISYLRVFVDRCVPCQSGKGAQARSHTCLFLKAS